jgi:pimeloyl-ACP methyl ester carboxylesterase
MSTNRMTTNRLPPSLDHFELHTEIRGPMRYTGSDRTPVVFVHGSWTDADSWQLVAPAIAAERVTVVYDRRGHSRSPWTQPVTRRRDEDDLIALIEHIGSRSVHLVGNSYGASIALAVAGRRPDLVASVVAHEPPLLGAASPGTPLEHELDALRTLALEIAATIDRGEAAEAAERFTETALGEGAWAFLPREVQATFIANASTFAGMVRDPGYDQVPDLARHPMPIVLTSGTASPGWLPAIVDQLVAAHPNIGCDRYEGAGHVPHLTHPVEVIATISRVIEAAEQTAADVAV